MLFAKIVVIKRNGSDGAHFPLTATSCLFGRGNECDIRIQIPQVSKEHCRVTVNEDGEVFLTNLSEVNPVFLNNKPLHSTAQLKHSNVFTIVDRSFRLEFPEDSPKFPIGRSPSPKKDGGKILSPKLKPPQSSPFPKPKGTPLKPLTPSSQFANVKSGQDLFSSQSLSPKKTPVSKDKIMPVSSPKMTTAGISDVDLVASSTPAKLSIVPLSQNDNVNNSATPKSKSSPPARKSVSPAASAKKRVTSPSPGRGPKSGHTPRSRTPKSKMLSASPKSKSPRAPTPKTQTPRASTPKTHVPRTSSPKDNTSTPPRAVTPKSPKSRNVSPRVSSAKSDASEMHRGASPKMSDPGPSTPRAEKRNARTPKSASAERKPTSPVTRSPSPNVVSHRTPNTKTGTTKSASPKSVDVKTPHVKKQDGKRKSMPAGSPYPASSSKLKSNLAEMRRRSQPVPEVKETPASSPEKNSKTPRQTSGKKRKSTEQIAPSAKRKRVSFGPKLSPEHFDKRLPPSTPIKKGAMPIRMAEQGPSDSPRPLLKRRSGAASLKSPIKEESPWKSPARKSTEKSSSKKSSDKISPKKSPKKSPVKSTGKKTPVRSLGKSKNSPSRSAKGTPKANRSYNATPQVVIPTHKIAIPSPAIVFSAISNTPKSKIPAKAMSLFLATPRSTSESPARSTSPKTTMPRTATPRTASKSLVRSKSPKGTNLMAGTPAKALSDKRATGSTSPKVGTPKFVAKSPTRSVSPKAPTPRDASKSLARKSTSPKASVPKDATPRTASKSPERKNTSPKELTHAAATPRAGSKSPVRKSTSPKASKRTARSVSPKPFTPRAASTSPARSSSSKVSTPKEATPVAAKGPARSVSPKPVTSKVSTSTVATLRTASKSPARKSASPKALTPKAVTPIIASKSPARKTRNSNVSISKAATPEAAKSPARSVSPKRVTPRTASTSPARSPSSKVSTPKAAIPVAAKSPARSVSPKSVTPKVSTPTESTPRTVSKSPARSASPKLSTPRFVPLRSERPTSVTLRAASKSPERKSTSLKASTPKTVTSHVASKSPARKSTSPKAHRPEKTVSKSPARSTSPKASTPRSVYKSPKVEAIDESLEVIINANNPKKTKTLKSSQKASSATPRKTPKSSAKKSKTSGNKKAARRSSAGIGSTSFSGNAHIGFIGLKEMMRTPKTNKNGKKQIDQSFTGLPELFATPLSAVRPKREHSSPKDVRDASLTGINEMLKTPSPKKTASPTISTKKSTPKVTPEATPNPTSTKKTSTSVARKGVKRHASTPKEARSAKKLRLGEPIPKIVTPPIEIKKAVVLRAIHGKNATPRVPAKTWSDIVKSGVAQKGLARRQSGTRPLPAKVVRQPSPRPAATQVPPKTPRSKAAILAPSTGHADSPITIVIGKKKHVVKTPKSLPKKGRKSLKVARKSMGNTSYSGIADLFTTPPSANKSLRSSVGTPHSLYSEIPDTPDGPGEMFVSPLSTSTASKSSTKKSRQSVLLSGVKELFGTKKPGAEPTYEGIKRLMATPKQKKTADQDAISPTGLARLFPSPHKTPKQQTPAKSVQKRDSKSPDVTKEHEAKSSVKARRGKTRVRGAVVPPKTPSPLKPRRGTKRKASLGSAPAVTIPMSKKAKSNPVSPAKQAEVESPAVKSSPPAKLRRGGKKTPAKKALKTMKRTETAVSPAKSASPVNTAIHIQGESPKKAAKPDRKTTRIGSEAAASPVKQASPLKARSTRRGAKSTKSPAKVDSHVKPASPAVEVPLKLASPVAVKTGHRAKALVKSVTPAKAKTSRRGAKTAFTRTKWGTFAKTPSPVKGRTTRGSRAAHKTPVSVNKLAAKERSLITKSPAPEVSPAKPATPIRKVTRGKTSVKMTSSAKKSTPAKQRATKGRKVATGAKKLTATPVAVKAISPLVNLKDFAAPGKGTPKETSPVKARFGRGKKTITPAKKSSPKKKIVQNVFEAEPTPVVGRRGTRAKPATPAKSASKRKAVPDQSTSPNKMQKTDSKPKAITPKKASPAKQSSNRKTIKLKVSPKSTLGKEETLSSPVKGRRGTRAKPISEKPATSSKSASKRKAKPFQATSPNKIQKIESKPSVTSPKKASPAKQSTRVRSKMPAVSPKSSLAEKGNLSSPKVQVYPTKGRKAFRGKAASPASQSPEMKQINSKKAADSPPKKASAVKQTRGKKAVSPVKVVSKEISPTDAKDVTQLAVILHKASPVKRTARGKAKTISSATVPATTNPQAKTASPAKMLAKGKTLIKSPVVAKRVTRARK
ncbi:hypothetical protein CHS0354_000052 [Potamilus streckersoni]|uniref:FHA domain-containing protein n=1 Tax=Potamilus streckersoni TaxID=2493646 RepID=A0AAE0RLC4_9BIVA|nr:hypothetical protein CHS0354_000052 [Potamilus streckersoni]